MGLDCRQANMTILQKGSMVRCCATMETMKANVTVLFPMNKKHRMMSPLPTSLSRRGVWRRTYQVLNPQSLFGYYLGKKRVKGPLSFLSDQQAQKSGMLSGVWKGAVSLVTCRRLSWLPVDYIPTTNYPATTSSNHSCSAPVENKVNKWGGN